MPRLLLPAEDFGGAIAFARWDQGVTAERGGGPTDSVEGSRNGIIISDGSTLRQNFVRVGLSAMSGI